MSWQQSVYRDAAERLGVGPGVKWSITIDPDGRWMEFWREDQPERRVRYAIEPCPECDGATWLAAVVPTVPLLTWQG